MAGVVMNAELLFNHPSNHGRRPHPAVQAVGDWTTVQNVAQLGALLRGQCGRPPGSVSFQQALQAVLLIPR